MNATILGLLAESSVHPGSGRSMGVVDLPVAREAATDYPVLVGSSIKGALRDKAEGGKQDNASHYFGKANHAGNLLVSDGRLLLLPVRSLTGSYRWVTCPYLIERFNRDLARAGHAPQLQIPEVKRDSVFVDGEGKMFLEERQFDIISTPPKGIAEAIKPLILHRETQDRLAKQLALLHDDDFAWFARYGLAIQARNSLDDGTKKSGNLWYEETLPPDTVMYTLVAGRGNTNPNEALHELLPENNPYLQAGGNETVGQGWFATRVYSSDNGEVS